MKKGNFIIAIMFASMSVACTNESANESATSNETKLVEDTSPKEEISPIEAMIEGNEFKALNLSARATHVTPILTITGATSEGSSITLKMGEYKGEGVYELGMDKVNENQPIANLVSFVEVKDGEVVSYYSVDGKIEITSTAGGVISGNFSAELKNRKDETMVKTITEGEIKMKSPIK